MPKVTKVQSPRSRSGKTNMIMRPNALKELNQAVQANKGRFFEGMFEPLAEKRSKLVSASNIKRRK